MQVTITRSRRHLEPGFRLELEQGKFSDLVVECRDQQLVRTHKVILASASDFFAALEPTESRVRFDDVDGKLVRLLVDFMYFGKVTVEEEDMDEFLLAGKRLGVRDLPGNGDERAGTEEARRGLLLDSESTTDEVFETGVSSAIGDDLNRDCEARSKEVSAKSENQQLQSAGKQTGGMAGISEFHKRLVKKPVVRLDRMPVLRWEKDHFGDLFNVSPVTNASAAAEDVDTSETTRGYPATIQQSNGSDDRDCSGDSEEEGSFALEESGGDNAAAKADRTGCRICDNFLASMAGRFEFKAADHGGSIKGHLTEGDSIAFMKPDVIDQYLKIRDATSLQCRICAKMFISKRTFRIHSLSCRKPGQKGDGKPREKKTNDILKGKRFYGRQVGVKTHKEASQHGQPSKCPTCQRTLYSDVQLNRHKAVCRLK